MAKKSSKKKEEKKKKKNSGKKSSKSSKAEKDVKKKKKRTKKAPAQKMPFRIEATNGKDTVNFIVEAKTVKAALTSGRKRAYRGIFKCEEKKVSVIVHLPNS